LGPSSGDIVCGNASTRNHDHAFSFHGLSQGNGVNGYVLLVAVNL
jgi:hypothetical protein